MGIRRSHQRTGAGQSTCRHYLQPYHGVCFTTNELHDVIESPADYINQFAIHALGDARYPVLRL